MPAWQELLSWHPGITVNDGQIPATQLRIWKTLLCSLFSVMLQKQINYCGNTEKVTKAVKLYDWNVFSSFQVQRTAHQPPPARNTGGSPKEIILIVPRSADI